MKKVEEYKKEVTDLFESGKYIELLQLLEEMTPRTYSEVFVYLVNSQYEEKRIEVFEVLFDNLSTEQYKKLRWLGSSEREYLMSIPEDELTDQDWADLRACDF